MNTKHTPGPWHADGLTIESKGGNICLLNLARKDDETEANAAFIVRACNSHADLVAAVELLLGYIDSPIVPEGACEKVCTMARSVLSKAKGE